jgi:plastocyanin
MLIGCLAAVLIVGCGSSSSSSGKEAQGAGETAATTSSTPSTAQGGLKLSGKPRFASPSPSAPVQSGTVHVAYRNITINPDTLRVKVGTTVTWTNFDSIEHNVTSEGGPQRFASGTFGEGHSFSVRLTKPGVIHYEDTIHPVTMNGTIEVVR